MNKVIISGGGTGGHIFPALAIANEIKLRYPSCEVLFIGALGKMEMERVPAAGYKIIGLDIRGFQRGKIMPNLLLPMRIVKSLFKARATLRSFQPDAVIGVGGYASGPTLKMAQLLGIPTFIQEQNSYAGKTNQLLAKKAKCICVAYDGMSAFFGATKLYKTGNPVRREIIENQPNQEEAKKQLGFDSSKKLILVIGGSLGARSINNAILENKALLEKSDVQLLWQTGKFYFEEVAQNLNQTVSSDIKVQAFIDNMGLAYSAADLIISRAGALSVSELCLVGKPILLVPSPNVSEDHQTKNAQALVSKNAALLVKDAEAKDKLVALAIDTLQDDNRIESLSANLRQLGLPNATKDIVDVIEKELDAK